MKTEYENFDDGFKKGVRDYEARQPDMKDGAPNDPYKLGYLMGVIYSGENKHTESSKPAWEEVSRS